MAGGVPVLRSERLPVGEWEGGSYLKSGLQGCVQRFGGSGVPEWESQKVITA